MNLNNQLSHETPITVLKQNAEDYDLQDISVNEDGVCRAHIRALSHRDGSPLLRVEPNDNGYVVEARLVLPRNGRDILNQAARGLVRRELAYIHCARSGEITDDYRDSVERSTLQLHTAVNAQLKTAAILDAFILSSNDVFDSSHAGRDSRDGEVWVRCVERQNDEDAIDNAIQHVVTHCKFIQNTYRFVLSVLEPDIAGLEETLSELLAKLAKASSSESEDANEQEVGVTI